MADATTPDEFDPIFRQGVLVVGGHAVNLWGSYYAHRGDRELQQFAPFISKDGDIFLHDKAMAVAVAATAGWNFRENREVRSPILGHIYLVKADRELRVDVLRSVTGVTEEDLAVTQELQFVGGRRYTLPAPDVMLKAKLANLAMHNQDDRQDARHVRIMVACCRHFLEDAYAAAIAGHLGEREAVDCFMSTIRVIREPRATETNVRHTLNLSAAIPPRTALAELPRLPRLSAFYVHQVKIHGPHLST